MRLFLVVLLVVVAQSRVLGQRYSAMHSLWAAENSQRYYLVFQDSIAYFEEMVGKDRLGYHDYGKIDTLKRVDENLYIGRKTSILKCGSGWFSGSLEGSSLHIIFRKPNNQEYKKWVATVNWYTYDEMIRGVKKKLTKEECKAIGKLQPELIEKARVMPLVDYQTEVSRFEERYLKR